VKIEHTRRVASEAKGIRVRESRAYSDIPQFSGRIPANRRKPMTIYEQVARAIGRAVLHAAEHYEQKTGKPSLAVVVDLKGKLPRKEMESLKLRSNQIVGCNHYHYSFSVKAQGAPGNSKIK
jgi:hypothetical protein